MRASLSDKNTKNECFWRNLHHLQKNLHCRRQWQISPLFCALLFQLLWQLYILIHCRKYFFPLCEKWRGNNFVIKPFSSILLVSEFLFTTKNISCFIEHHFTPEDTVVIVMAGGFWFWTKSQLSLSNHFWSFFVQSLHLCSIISIVVLKPFLSIFSFLHYRQSPHEYLCLNTFLTNCSVHKSQRPLHRRNWAPPNIIAIIPCANVAEISNYLIFFYINQKSRTSPSWYFDANLNSNEVTNFHVLWKVMGLQDTHSNGKNPQVLMDSSNGWGKCETFLEVFRNIYRYHGMRQCCLWTMPESPI